MDCRLELVILPVTDVDRALEFYENKVGFVVDHDHTVQEGLRFVQCTPRGSACSIAFGLGLLDEGTPPVAGLQVVVEDAHAAREELIGRGVDASEVQDLPWGSFTSFSDPDENRWSVQQIPPRG
jgi:catechol 2,3-dioxygenase-like lactoylglutathione lyase family enzyme